MNEKPGKSYQFGLARLLAVTALVALFSWVATWDEVPGQWPALVAVAAVAGIVASSGTVRASALCGGLAAAVASPLPIWLGMRNDPPDATYLPGPELAFLLCPIIALLWGGSLGAAVAAIRSEMRRPVT